MVAHLSHIDPAIYQALYEVSDPEIPVLSVLDLGVVRKVKENNKHLEVDITPTYSGCPAMDMIAVEIKYALESIGYTAKVNLVLTPAWTTDFITEQGKQKLLKYGIAPPLESSLDKQVLFEDARLVPCPQCQSTNTKLVSQFGSTACKSLFKCEECLEPFDYFKCHK